MFQAYRFRGVSAMIKGTGLFLVLHKADSVTLSLMTLEQINDIEDKAERLRLLNDYIARVIQETHDADEIVADEQMNASRDEAHGMMSRFGGPGSE